MSAFKQAAGGGGAVGRGVVWFKGNDLRVQDHAPLLSAHSQCSEVDHVFVFDPRQFRTTALGNVKYGPRRFAWLCECLVDLNQSLEQYGSSLLCIVGRPEEVLPSLGSSKVFAHSEVAEEELTVQRSVASSLSPASRLVESWGGGTLLDLGTLPFDPKVKLPFFTGFRKEVEATNVIASLKVGPPFPPAGAGGGVKPQSGSVVAAAAAAAVLASELQGADKVSALYSRMLLEGSRYTECFRGGGNVGGCAPGGSPSSARASAAAAAAAAIPIPQTVDPRAAFALPGGESAGQQRIAHYILQGTGRLSVYKETRNGLVGLDYSSKLSPYLASGCVTARQVLAAIRSFETSPGGVSNESTYWLIFELLWRDYMRFYAMRHGRAMFFLGGPQGAAGRAKWPWQRDADKFARWALGRTGYPVVDAHMRELLLTGFMSNRGRQIVASFLVRDLELDWRLGAEHFEATLVDHDVCSNFGNWQYAAGVGADPREDRYFNIAKQAKDYDPKAEHIRRWLPEARHLPDRVLLDARQLTPALREQFKIDDHVIPLPVCSLMMDRNPKPTFPLPGGGGGGGGGNPRMKGGSGKKGQQHGAVPGRR